MEIEALQARLNAFAVAREWTQFHTPKNLAMALAVEASELLEIFQWLSPIQSENALEDRELRLRVEDECADVLIYLARFADIAGIDLIAAAQAKIDRNEERFPA
jgi:NTP pyrophosphatase (non-canonical NTP hydrolase)